MNSSSSNSSASKKSSLDGLSKLTQYDQKIGQRLFNILERILTYYRSLNDEQKKAQQRVISTNFKENIYNKLTTAKDNIVTIVQEKNPLNKPNTAAQIATLTELMPSNFVKEMSNKLENLYSKDIQKMQKPC